jgi:hypothetical protein
MATINYFGLTKKGTVTVNLTVTIDQLITAIATDEVLATEYYTVSAMNDFSKSSLTFGDSSTTLTQLGLVDGGTVLCTTNQTGSKQERQVAKLAIAGKKRLLSGRPSTLTIDNLPTKYTGNAVTDNANVDGLVTGRPWTAPSGDAAGLFKTTYAGYAEDNVNFFATATPTTFGANPATSVQTTEIFEPNSDDVNGVDELFSVQWLGYFKPTTTETHTFYLNSDDGSYMWIGATAVTGFTAGNALINNSGAHAPVEVSGSIALTAGQSYPVRIQYGEGGGGDELQFNYETPTIAKTTDVTGKVFYNTATNGF